MPLLWGVGEVWFKSSEKGKFYGFFLIKFVLLFSMWIGVHSWGIIGELFGSTAWSVANRLRLTKAKLKPKTKTIPTKRELQFNTTLTPTSVFFENKKYFDSQQSGARYALVSDSRYFSALPAQPENSNGAKWWTNIPID